MLDLDTSTLFAGLILGLIGTAFFLFGRRSLDIRSMVGGVLIGSVPMFFHPAWAVWLTGLGATAGLLAWLNAARLLGWWESRRN